MVIVIRTNKETRHKLRFPIHNSIGRQSDAFIQLQHSPTLMKSKEMKIFLQIQLGTKYVACQVFFCCFS